MEGTEGTEAAMDHPIARDSFALKGKLEPPSCT